MRILFDSKQLQFKSPFGTLTPGQSCRLCIHIPSSVKATHVECRMEQENGAPAMTVTLPFWQTQGAYDLFEGQFQFAETGLYFYYFYIVGATGGFRLFKYGDDTNMEDGALWQISCVPADFTTPPWAKGGLIYQVFPDRFCKSGNCDLSEKLTPYSVHENWNEEVTWQPTAEGLVLNNDFYGGNFQGITEKMDYIASLGTSILYLNPISKSFSNHRYDTGDYKTPDPMLGTMEDFRAMCQAAHQYGIKVILDGVYSHTGSNSLYFNREGAFGEGGAYNAPSSPYTGWYCFQQWPDRYHSWWGFDTLPTINKLNPDFIRYIIEDDDSVVTHWLNAGCDGFRLDVADELPSEFLALLKRRIRQIRPDALLIGEVWEDASNKISYNKRCRYFVDGVLDSVMNYPFRTAILNFVTEQNGGWALRSTVMTIAENYPHQVLHSNMNLLGTHDTPRILTALADPFEGSREEMAHRFLSPEQIALAVKRLMLATALQYTLPGIPSLYYGDEAGMEGHKDPFNRRPYPWGQENPELLAHFRSLGALRKACPALQEGDISFIQADGGVLEFTRTAPTQTLRICINRSAEPQSFPAGKLLLTHQIAQENGESLTLCPMGFCILEN